MKAFIKLMRTTINILQIREKKKFYSTFGTCVHHNAASPTFIDYWLKRLSFDENEMKKKNGKKIEHSRQNNGNETTIKMLDSGLTHIILHKNCIHSLPTHISRHSHTFRYVESFASKQNKKNTERKIVPCIFFKPNPIHAHKLIKTVRHHLCDFSSNDLTWKPPLCTTLKVLLLRVMMLNGNSCSKKSIPENVS